MLFKWRVGGGNELKQATSNHVSNLMKADQQWHEPTGAPAAVSR